jgi:hypothetical protein
MHTIGTLAGTALAAAAVIAAPAGAAVAESPAETISQLQAQGYTVNVDRVGSARLEDCVVTSVRNPQTVTKLVRVYRNGGRHRDGDGGRGGHGDRDYDLVEVVVSKSISVSLNCAL